MELENRINEYKVSVIHIETMIDEIKKLGIDTSSFETQFKSITKRGDISANQSNIAVATMPNYGSLITELKRLEQLIRKYEQYYTAIKNAHYVAENISPYDDAEKIKEYAKYMLVALKIIRNLSGEAFIDESKALQQIYEIAYQVIKIEIIKTGGSIILKNIGDIEKTYIDKYIKADLKTINTENKKYASIRKRIFDIERQGLGTSYCDLELIRLIIINTKNEYKDSTIKKLEEYISTINQNDQYIISSISGLKEYLDNKKTYKKRSIKYKKEIGKDIISLVLAYSLAIGSGYGVYKLAESESTKNIYNVETTTYTEGSDYPEISSEVSSLRQSDANDSRLLIYYSAWEEGRKGYSREVFSYDFSDITLDDVYDYFKHDLDKKMLESSETITENYELDKDKYQQEFKQLIETRYEDTGESFVDKDELTGDLILGYFFYLVLGVISYGLWSIAADHFVLLPDELMYDIEELKKLKKEYGINNKEFNKKIKEIMDKINANRALKSEFEKIFEENKYLLANPDELMKQVQELETKREKEVKILKKRRIFG